MTLYFLHDRLKIRQSSKLLLSCKVRIDGAICCRYSKFSKLPVADPSAESHASKRRLGGEILFHRMSLAVRDDVEVIRIRGPVCEIARMKQCVRASVEGRLQVQISKFKAESLTDDKQWTAEIYDNCRQYYDNTFVSKDSPCVSAL